ncbi:hypothetical protein BN2475_190006 [Paraburkholderia ribeironis]|uniref:Uncharacterized protein n=1 Tax=Paraburkholderia ribeironis TaxID=1247936 RepID=A0A1N7RV60_9BURK|nr:hypothetical protein BN2475_190006 [Paraburkholderia ribeironis]
MTDSLVKATASRFVRLLQRLCPRRTIVLASKKVHYIGSVKLGIALARVVSVILTVEGYACAPQPPRAGPGPRTARAPKEVPLGGAPKEVLSGDIPKTAKNAG